MSRIVYEISSNELLKSRTGFLNTLAPNGDTISNWYSNRFSNKTQIEKMHLILLSGVFQKMQKVNYVLRAISQKKLIIKILSLNLILNLTVLL